MELKKKKKQAEMGAAAYEYGHQESDDCCEGKKCYEDEEDEEEDDYYDYPRNPTPPDGGWAWVVMVASFLCMFTIDGICFAFPCFSPLIMAEFGSTHGKTFWVGSTVAGSYLLAGELTRERKCDAQLLVLQDLLFIF